MTAAVVILALSCVGLLGTTLLAWSRAVELEKKKATAEKEAEQLHRDLAIESTARKRDYEGAVAEREFLQKELQKVRAARNAAETPDSRNDRLAGLLHVVRPDPKPSGT